MSSLMPRGFPVFYRDSDGIVGVVGWHRSVVRAITHAQDAQIHYELSRGLRGWVMAGHHRTVIVRDAHSLVQVCPMIEYERAHDGSERARMRRTCTWVQLSREIPERSRS